MSKAAELAALIGSQSSLSNRNLIINGAMQVAQRGTSTASITSDTYGASDRWHVQVNSCGTWTVSQSTTVPSGQGFTNSFKLECTTADASPAAGDYVLFAQRIEAQNLQHLAFGTSSAKTITLSFWVRSNKTGTIATEIYHHDAAKHFNSNFTIDSAGTWEHKKITIDGNTADIINNDNGIGFLVYWWFASGSDFNTSQSTGTWNNTGANRATTYNLADTVGNEVYITGVQLEVGEQATPFEHRSFGEELDRCKRYYQNSFAYGTAPANDIFGVRMAVSKGGDSTVYGGARVDFEKTMRAIPTITAYNPLAAPANSGAYLNDINNSSTTTQYAITGINAYEGSARFVVGGFNQGGNDFGCNWTADAEL